MAAQTKTIYGQPFLADESLMQDVTLLVINGQNSTSSENTVVIIENIWNDLKSKTGKFKNNGKGFWYWEVDVTDMEDPDKTMKVKYPCPKPTMETFENNIEVSENDSAWTTYWKLKMKVTLDSLYNSTNAVQRKQVTLAGTTYVDQNGNVITLPAKTVINNDLGDIQNLLINLF